MKDIRYSTLVNGRPVTTIFTPTKIEILGLENGAICTMHDHAGAVHVFTAAMPAEQAEACIEALQEGIKLTDAGFAVHDRIKEGMFYRRVGDLSNEFIIRTEKKTAAEQG